MRSLESSKRKALDYISDNELVIQKDNKKLGNRGGLGTLSPVNIDSDTLLAEIDQLLGEIDQLLGEEGDISQTEADVGLDDVDEGSALDKLKQLGLFSEQEAGKTTLLSRLSEKERAEAHEKALESIQRTAEELISL